MGEATSFGPVIYGEILQSGYSVRLGWGEGKPSSWAGGGHGTNSPGYRPGVPANSNTLLLLGPVQTRQNIVGLIIQPENHDTDPSMNSNRFRLPYPSLENIKR